MRHVLSRAIVGTLAASAAFAPSATAAPSFSAPVQVPAQAGAIATAVGDFNGDGHQDLAVANNGFVAVRLGTGSGSFTVPSSGDFPVHGVAQAVVAADFNRDGRLDVATANNSSNDVSVLLGNGDGTFGPKTDFSTGNNPRTVSVGDFNEDGKLDLAVAIGDATPGHVAVLLGTTPGSFSAPTAFAAGAAPVSVAVADFNNDGHQDLAVANAATINFPDGDIAVLLGTGGGSFSAQPSYVPGTGANLRGLATGDFNGDGNEDLAATDIAGGSTVAVGLGTGTGFFGAPSRFTVDNNPDKLAVADFDRDGRLDLAVASQGGGDASVLLGSGTGSFGAATNFPAHAGPRGIATADFNGDGKQDIAVVNATAQDVSVLLNTTTVPVLAQLGSPNGCRTFAATSGCGSLTGSGFQPSDVAVGPDGSGPSNVYLASPQGIVVLNRDRTTGVLTQAGCLATSTANGCTQLHGLTGAVDGQLGVSPDGKSVYMATGVALLTLTRNTTTGALTPLSCINQDASDTCTQDRQGTSFVPDWVRVGPEGTSAYAGPGPNQAAGVMSEFTRNTTTGALTQAGDATGCVSGSGLDGSGGPCGQVDELANQTDIAFSASGKTAWVSSHSSDTIVGFSRSTSTGVLTPLTGANRCVVDADSAPTVTTCAGARALKGAGRMVRAGKNLYVTTSNGTDEGVAEFETRPGGALAQLPGASGCLTTSGHDGETLTPGNCTRSRVTAGGGDMAGPREFVSTPDGVDLFVEGEGNAAVTTLGRDVETGALSDVACVGDNTGGSTCSQGTGMPDLSGIAMAPDGRNVYGSTANGIVALNRHLRRSVTGSASPPAGGSVAASSSSLNAQCSGSACTVEDGGTVTLTATASSGYRFTGWSGACAGQSSPCTVQNVTGDQTATANFARRVTVNGSASPTAGGSVAASSPSGGATCAGASCTVDAGSNVTLTETPAAGYRFGGWSGACSGSAPICTFSNVTADQTATATFVRRYTVSGSANPAAGGSVIASSSAPGAVCTGSACVVDAGDAVSLRPNPASGYEFTGWSGACTGSTEPCTVSNVNSDLSAIAAFTPLAGSTSTGGASTVTASKDGSVPTGITVHCPKPCTFIGIGKVTVPKALAGKRAAAARNVTLTVAKVSKALKPGGKAKVVLKLTKKGMKLLKRLHKLRLKVAVNVTAPGAAPVSTKRTLTVKAPKRKGH